MTTHAALDRVKTMADYRLAELRARHAGLRRVIGLLTAEYPVMLAGGALRAWCCDRRERDLDLVVDGPIETVDRVLAGLPVERNSFGGRVTVIDGCMLDVWALGESRAFDDAALRWGVGRRTFHGLLEAMAFGVDAIGYELATGAVLDAGFASAIEARVLEMRREPYSAPPMVIARGLSLMVEYGLKANVRFADYCAKHPEVTLDEIQAVQRKRYGVALTTAENAPGFLRAETVRGGESPEYNDAPSSA